MLLAGACILYTAKQLRPTGCTSDALACDESSNPTLTLPLHPESALRNVTLWTLGAVTRLSLMTLESFVSMLRIKLFLRKSADLLTIKEVISIDGEQI
jgi:hypothetical protein